MDFIRFPHLSLQLIARKLINCANLLPPQFVFTHHRCFRYHPRQSQFLFALGTESL